MYRMTGHPVVDAIGQMNITGNVIPHSWYQHIRYSNKRGNYPDMLAVAILSDLVYWYRPTEVRDEISLHLIGWRKKFKEDKLQCSPIRYANMFGVSVKQVRQALKLLENLSLITIELRSIKTGFGTIPTAMFIEINPSEIARITYQVNPEIVENSLLPNSVTRGAELGNKGCPVGQQGVPNSVTRGAELGTLTLYRDYSENKQRTHKENSRACEKKLKEENKESQTEQNVSQPRLKKKQPAKKSPSDPFTLWKQEITPETWDEFLLWKAEQAPSEIRDPLGWAYNTLKCDLDRAQLSLQSFQNEKNESTYINGNTTPNFAFWSREEHLTLAQQYLAEGMTFLKENEWHLLWVEYINTNLPTFFDEIQEERE